MFSQNGVVDSIIVEKIMKELRERAPITKRVYERDLQQIVALVRLDREDMRQIEHYLNDEGYIKRSGKTIYILRRKTS